MSFVFPSLWELLIPNDNMTTAIGIVLFVMALLSLKFLSGFRWGEVATGILFLASIFFVWGFSILEDVISSPLGNLIFWGIVIIVVVWYFLFKLDKKK